MRHACDSQVEST